MADPKSIDDIRREANSEEADSLKSLYNMVHDKEGYEGSLVQDFVEHYMEKLSEEHTHQRIEDLNDE